MKIQQLTEADAVRYQELRLFGLQESPSAFGISYEEEVERRPEEVAARLRDPLNHLFGAISEEGELVGTALLRREHYEKSRHKGNVFAVYVRPEYRRRGAGRALMEAVIDRARELGLRQLNLSVVTDNPEPQRLYEACGFEQFGLERDAFCFENEFFDAAYMVLWLGEEGPG